MNDDLAELEISLLVADQPDAPMLLDAIFGRPA